MKRKQDLTGMTFGRLTVLEKLEERDRVGNIRYRCVCSCSAKTELVVRATSMKVGSTKSCGCLRKENTGNMFRTHGQYGTPEYFTWIEIHRRCYNPKSDQYKDYGGRGIVVSDEWKENFLKFNEDMGPRPSKNHSIERADNNEGYCKENCYWATKLEQANNTRASVFYIVNSEKLTIAQLARKYSFPYATMRIRLLQLPPWAAINKHIKFESFLHTLGEETKTMKEWLLERDVPSFVFQTRKSKRVDYRRSAGIDTQQGSRV